jgi:hypothetical protein
MILTDPAIPPANINELTTRTKTFYNGKMEIGEDLMIIEIGEKITVRKTN